jgi:hypothetical protein
MHVIQFSSSSCLKLPFKSDVKFPFIAIIFAQIMPYLHSHTSMLARKTTAGVSGRLKGISRVTSTPIAFPRSRKDMACLRRLRIRAVQLSQPNPNSMKMACGAGSSLEIEATSPQPGPRLRYPTNQVPLFAPSKTGGKTLRSPDQSSNWRSRRHLPHRKRQPMAFMLCVAGALS